MILETIYPYIDSLMTEFNPVQLKMLEKYCGAQLGGGSIETIDPQMKTSLSQTHHIDKLTHQAMHSSSDCLDIMVEVQFKTFLQKKLRMA